MQPSREAISIPHVRNIIELAVGESIDAMRNEGIELHITTGALGILEPFLFTSNKERWENSRLHHRFAIIFLHTDIR
jgi:hypothetical protein